MVSALYRGDFRMLTHKAEMISEVPESEEDPQGLKMLAGQNPRTTVNQEWNQELGKRMKEKALKDQQDKVNARMGVKTLDEFRQQLKVKFGSLVTAWRQGLDADGNGRISFGEFCMALR